MELPDPLRHIENELQELHHKTHRLLHPAYKRYPTLFLFLVTFSVAAVFQGLDEIFGQIGLFDRYPLLLILLGIVGLFITGGLYKRLGKDRYEE